MKKKYLKIVALVFLLAAVIGGLHLTIHQKTDWKNLREGNIEALTSPETEDTDYPCIKANGFCLIDRVKIEGIALTPTEE